MTKQQDYIRSDPVAWIERLKEVNMRSAFTERQRKIIARHFGYMLEDLKSEHRPSA